MSKEQLLAEILRLPREARRELLDDAIESLPEDFVADPDMTPELRAELDRRYRHMIANPNDHLTWEEACAELDKRRNAGQ